MAKVEDLIKNIPDARLRDELAREVAKLKSEKKFGLVFEEHLPEQVLLPGLPIKPGVRVVRRGAEREIFTVLAPEDAGRKGVRFRIARDSDGEEVIAVAKELVVIKKFGEPIYPTLVPIDRVTRAPERPYHTIINAENFHALQLLLYCYEGQIDVIYIDPPYNTGARDWKYNNNYVDKTDQFRHSKWLSMMKKRLLLAKRLLKNDGVLIVTIDDYELFHLGALLENLYPAHDLFIVTIEHNKRGRRGKNFAKSNEWALFLVPHGCEVIQEEKTQGLIGGEQRNLRRTGSGSKRVERPRKFYPILVNERTLEVVGAGDPIPKDSSWKITRKDGLVSVWPIDQEGKEKNWHYGVDRTRRSIEEGTLEARKREYGIQVYFTLREKDSKKYKTVWSNPTLDASTYGSELLDEILGDDADFDYPKSLYAVVECLKAAAGARKDAVILDFFAGSGTTLHATLLLNSLQGFEGNRKCILVTNNEVREAVENQLNAEGLYAGDRGFEQFGICESVTWPRSKYVLTGRRDDGTELSGKYLDGRSIKNGFKENIEYLKLDFLDPNDVAYGDKLEAIIPILWLMAGAKGDLQTERSSLSSTAWIIRKGSPYAVLIQEDYFAEFKRELKERPDVTHVFLVTDSEESYREMIAQLPGSAKTKMLYKSYLENFRINTERNL
jgi:adenine-specific DNA-methyltransferase